jgi:hypothetical protein
MQNNNTKTLRERIDDHLGLTITGFVIAGFTAGFSCYGALAKFWPASALVSHTARSDDGGNQAAFDPSTDIGRLTQAHIERINKLQAEFADADGASRDPARNELTKQSLRDSAGRISRAIEAENESYQNQVDSLRGSAHR